MTPHRWLAFWLAVMCAIGGIGNVLLSPLHAQNAKLEVELVAMADASRSSRLVQRTSTGFGGKKITVNGPANPDEIQAVVATNGARLKEIVDQYGWPGKKLVGTDGAKAAWLVLIQIPDPAFLQRALSLMRKMRDQVGKLDFAYLTDIVAVQMNRPQTYGTQWDCTNGHLVLTTPLRDPASANQRRRDVGLPTVGEEYKRILHGFGSPDRPGCRAQLIGGDPATSLPPDTP